MKSVILAGGKGKRLRPLTDDKPKPMVEILGSPIIEWQILWLKSCGIQEIVLCTGYRQESIMDYIGDGSKFGVKIDYSIEEEPLGTAGALRNAQKSLQDEKNFLTINGDIMTDIIPDELIHQTIAPIITTMAVVPLQSPFGIVEIDDHNFIKTFSEKPILRDRWINAGIYCISSQIFNFLPESGSLESDVFPKLASNNQLFSIKYSDNKWRSIDNHKDIDEANKEFKKFH